MKKENKTHSLKIRLTEEEFAQFKEKAKAYNSISSMIRIAVEGLDSRTSKSKIEILTEFSTLLQEYDSNFSHVTGSLNQVVKRANQLSLSKALDVSFLKETLYPQILDTNKLIIEIKKMQKSLFSNLLKL